MNFLGPTENPRLNQPVGLSCLLISLGLAASLVSYSPSDPSLNTASGVQSASNLAGSYGAYFADLMLQGFGLAAFLIPVFLLMWAWRWMTSREIAAPLAKFIGFGLFVAGTATALGLAPEFRLWQGSIPAGGLIGLMLGDALHSRLNGLGSILLVAMALIVAVYLTTSFTLDQMSFVMAMPMAAWERLSARWAEARIRRQEERQAKRDAQAEARVEAVAEPPVKKRRRKEEASGEDLPIAASNVAVMDPPPSAREVAETGYFYDEPRETAPAEIPIHVLDPVYEEPEPVYASAVAEPEVERMPWDDLVDDIDIEVKAPPPEPELKPLPARVVRDYELPPTNLLTPIPGRSGYDASELKEIAGLVKQKFEEFAVRGQVVQINPGPVVTTYEFKPEPGIKLSKITSLDEDLSLGLEAESVRIERLPGKSTVGVEVPNRKSEVISLRQILESADFRESPQKLSFALGKDVEGRIRVTSMESMPHLLIAGATGAGKSVMLNSLLMSLLYKSTPNEVRMILIDPKRVELGIYEGIPHLLTPVITDPRKATIALKNAVLEMERRLKVMASVRARNIDIFNEKVDELKGRPVQLGLHGGDEGETLERLPYILIVIDELADLMMLERAGVEESVTRLAQMARAVGIHLVLATQRPSVDVITGLIKANFPARMSFRVSSRIDSRTILDSQGAEHLLGRGDMLFLAPRATRIQRMHGAYVSEPEISAVVEYWKHQAQPDYDQTYLISPDSDEEEREAEGATDDREDAMYRDAVRIVCDMGKASTSILQRRLRLGYGRAARILDMMQRDGIIGAPDGPRPRDVMKRPGWLDEVDIS